MKKSNIATSKDKTKYRGTAEWHQFRLEILKERDCTCEICGKKYRSSQLQVHHRYDCKTIEEYSNLDKKRFLVLCSCCHRFAHTKYNAPNFKNKQWFI